MQKLYILFLKWFTKDKPTWSDARYNPFSGAKSLLQALLIAFMAFLAYRSVFLADRIIKLSEDIEDVRSLCIKHGIDPRADSARKDP